MSRPVHPEDLDPSYKGPRYLMTSAELHAPEVGAVYIGSLLVGAYKATEERMLEKAKAHQILTPRMIADLIFSEGKQSELGSTGQPYPIIESEWDTFALDVPEYCGDNVPLVYMVDGDKYTAGI